MLRSRFNMIGTFGSVYEIFFYGILNVHEVLSSADEGFVTVCQGML